MKKGRILGSAMLISASVAVANANPTEQFDLLCVGTVVSHQIGNSPYFKALPVPSGEVPYTTHLRVNLENKLFCQDGCESAEGIFLIQPDKIVFRHTKELLGFDDLEINRTDGTFRSSWFQNADQLTRQPLQLKQANGKCEKAKYTPVPPNVF